VYDGYRSAWQLKDGERITTKDLTAALQLHPPTLVFSSSCESAQAGEAGPTRYEFQTFDLPSAYLAAGVEAYVGTLWQVEATAAHEFGKAFYDTFLSGKSLGECLRHAKEVCRAYERRVLSSEDQHRAVNWLAFVLYGDPHTRPGDLFPAMRPEEER
jgi:CHAT domain-containing protein